MSVSRVFCRLYQADCIREWASAEANPTYPVPVIYDQDRFIAVIRRVMR